MKNYQIEDFMNRVTIYQPMAVDESGTKIGFTSNLTGAPQVWLGEISEKVGKLLFPKPLTVDREKGPYIFQDSMGFIDSNRLAVMKDIHGNEHTHIEIHHLKTGEVEIVPKGDGKDYFLFVSENKKELYFSSTRDEASSTGLYRYHLTTKKVEFFHREKNLSLSWCKTKLYKGSQFFVVVKGNTSNHLKAIHLKTKKIIDVFTEDGFLFHPVELLSHDKLLVTTNYKRQFMSLAIMDLRTKEIKFLQKDQWDVEHVALTPDMKNIFISKNVGGKSVLEHLSYPSMKKNPIKFKTNGMIGNLAYVKKINSLIIGFMSPTEPKNFYRYQIKNKKLDRLTDSWTSVIPEKELCMPKSIFFPSQDNKIQSWLFMPKVKNKNQKVPVIIWPHGGPQAQERAQFRPIFQYFVHLGFAIWAPNHHGSSGFGLDFTNAINGQWGTKDLPDMINGIEWLKKSKLIDTKNMSIMGGSYGGYMTLRSITKISQTFKVAVDIFGPSNLLSFIDSVPPDWKPFMDLMVGNSERDYEKLKEQSPLFSLDRIDCPLFVVQGGRDPRVVKKESDQLVEQMKVMKKTVDYLVFDDEGHGFLKVENELLAYKKIAEFILKYANEKAFKE